MPMDAPQMLGKYEIRGTLGRGAMGTVYDGWDPLIARRVAIKTVALPESPDPETAEEIARFKREAQAAGRLTHPNIVAVYDYGETESLAYIVMEFVEGPSLKELLDRHERFALPDLQRVMEDLLAGLQFSHERGVVHRDIKPANIMLTRDGRAKIADFGIARIEASSMTQAGTMLGTPAYMSPEQFMAQVVDARSDVYSAGVVLYQLLTGERPFDGGLTAIMHKVLNTEPPPPSQLSVTAPAALDPVVRRAMAKRPEDRYPSAAAFAEAIRAALAQPQPAADAEATLVGSAAPARPAPAAPAVATPAPAPAPAAKPAGTRLPLLAGIAAVVVVALAGGAWFLLRPAAPPPSPSATITAATPAPAPPPAKVAEAQPAPAPPTPPPPPAATPAPAPQPPQPAPAAPAAEAPPVQPAPAAEAQPAAPPSAEPAQPQPAPVAEAQPAAPPPAEPAQARPAPPVQPAPTAPPPPPVEAAQAQPPPAPVQPPPPPQAPVAVAGLAPLRTLLDHAHCTLANAVLQDSGALSVTGVAGRSEAAALRTQADGLAGGSRLDWRVQPIDPVFCGALGVLQPIAAASGLAVTLAGGRTALHDGERIAPRVTMPDFAGELRVDYLGHDGSVVHLYPTVADPAQHVAAQPARRLAAGEVLALGDPGPNKPIWEVGPPYGTDMIIAIASAAPLPVHAPAQNAEDSATAYLRELAAAIAAARQAGTRVAGTLLLVDTLAK
jgi:predicted Ser/Thr protein kinase